MSHVSLKDSHTYKQKQESTAADVLATCAEELEHEVSSTYFSDVVVFQKHTNAQYESFFADSSEQDRYFGWKLQKVNILAKKCYDRPLSHFFVRYGLKPAYSKMTKAEFFNAKTEFENIISDDEASKGKKIHPL